MSVLDVTNVTVRFGGLLALDSVSLSIEPNEVTGLIGPNGAGKTTLFNVITGLQTPTNGRVALGERDITRTPAYKRARLGVGRTFQRLEVFDSLTVRDNIRVAAESIGSRLRPADRDVDDQVDSIIELVGLTEVADTNVDVLPTGLARLVELGRAFATEPNVLLCDECSSGLTDEETRVVANVVRRAASEGVAVLLVEHDMSFVMSTCDRINVLDLGRTIAEGTPDQIQQDATVRAAYLGAARDEPATRDQTTRSIATVTTSSNGDLPVPAPMIELRRTNAGYGEIDVVRDLDLQIAAGEVFALLGPNGAGKSTTLKVINGEVTPSSGDVLIAGHSTVGLPIDALARAGICTIPEGRGIFPNLTVDDNLRMSAFGDTLIDDIRERAFIQFPQLAVRRRQIAGTLSGGEQQMLALARALVVDPAVLLIDELSMGLAPLIVEHLYEIVAEIAASDHISIVIVEQFAQDVLGVATRAGIMLHGALVSVGDPSTIAETVTDIYLATDAN